MYDIIGCPCTSHQEALPTLIPQPSPSGDKLQCFVCIAEQVTELLTGLNLIKNEWHYDETRAERFAPTQRISSSYPGLKVCFGDSVQHQYNLHQATYDAD